MEDIYVRNQRMGKGVMYKEVGGLCLNRSPQSSREIGFTELSASWQPTKEMMAVALVGSILFATVSSSAHFQPQPLFHHHRSPLAPPFSAGALVKELHAIAMHRPKSSASTPIQPLGDSSCTTTTDS